MTTITISLTISSCKLEEDNIFAESSAVRLNNARKEYRQILSDAPNGWEMEYFPTAETEGYTFLMKFSNSDSVVIAAKNKYIGNTYKTETSFFDVIADDGPVLTFNSYNNPFHLFSNPEDPNGGTDLDGYGLKGDYEFIVLKADSNLMTLKGKKRGTYIYLRRLETTESWPSYFAKLDAMDAKLFSTNISYLNLVTNSSVIKAYDGITHLFSLLEPGGDPVSGEKNVPFIVTTYGIRFHSAYTYGSSTFQDFALNENETKLVSKEDANSYFEGPVLNTHLKESSSTWKMDTLNMSTNCKVRLRSLIAAMKKAYPTRSFEYFGIANKATYQNSFVLKLTGAEATFRVNFTAGNNDAVTISLPTDNTNLYDNNGKVFYGKSTEVATTLSFFSGAYKVSTKVPLSISRVHYERADNSNEFFEIYR